MTSITLYEEWAKAWFPSFVVNEDSYKISLEDYLIEKPSTTVCVRVIWNSMNLVGIMENDLILVDKAKWALEWQIVIAIIDWAYTIKFLKKDSQKRFYLSSANKTYPDFYPEESLEIFGVVVGCVRKYN